MHFIFQRRRSATTSAASAGECCLQLRYRALGFHAMLRALADPGPKKSRPKCSLEPGSFLQLSSTSPAGGGKIHLPYGVDTGRDEAEVL